MATNIFHTPPRAFIRAHTSAEIEEMFTLLELEHEERERERAGLHATD